MVVDEVRSERRHPEAQGRRQRRKTFQVSRMSDKKLDQISRQDGTGWRWFSRKRSGNEGRFGGRSGKRYGLVERESASPGGADAVNGFEPRHHLNIQNKHSDVDQLIPMRWYP